MPWSTLAIIISFILCHARQNMGEKLINGMVFLVHFRFLLLVNLNCFHFFIGYLYLFLCKLPVLVFCLVFFPVRIFIFFTDL